jgi:2-iminobutanoate/2-iminopropanoate deaminase
MTMPHRHIHSGPGVAAAGAPYSPAVVAGDLCFVSGQIALDPESGEYLPESLEQEARQALLNLFACLRAAEFSVEDVCSVTVLLADIGDFAAFNQVYADLMPDQDLPARIAYQAGALPLGAKVEVQAIARRQA